MNPKKQLALKLWLLLSFSFAVIYCVMALQKAFSAEYVVQDDVRQHVFWMLRYVDPELFPSDTIADYFQSVAPLGYSALYRCITYLGINPLVFNKLLPTAIALVSTYYCFVLCREFFPFLPGCFVATILLNQSLWFNEDLVSATPRAFVYPFFLGFLYYLTRESLLPCLMMITCIGFFYPQYLLICTGLLSFQLILSWYNSRKFKLALQVQRIYLLGLILAVSILLFYVLSISEYAPIITRAEALQLPEFHSQGRSEFFEDNFWDYLLKEGRGGLIPEFLFTPITLTMGLLLPILYQFPRQFPLGKKISPHIKLLPQLLAVSILMFSLAHILLFRLHLPSRYTIHSWRIIAAITAAISISIISETLVRKLIRKVPFDFNWQTIGEKIWVGILCSAIAIGIIAYPSFVSKFPITKYKTGKVAGLYQFLQQQPKDTMVASLTGETDKLPTFAQRSVLVSKEYAIPYHTGYYFPFRQRMMDLITAQYSSDPKTLQQFIIQYKINFFLLEQTSLTSEYIASNSWLMSYQPAAQQAVDNLNQGNIPAIANLQKECSVFTEAQLNLISTACILSQ